MDIDVVLNIECVQYMHTLPDNCIDTIITSPPYAKQRDKAYGGVSEKDFPAWMTTVGKEIYRILKPTGSFVLNIKEHVKNGARSTYVLKTVLALSEIFIWSDTFIWNKTNPFPTGNPRRLKDGFEYCYLFTKTTQFKFFPNNVLYKTTSKWQASEQKRKNKGIHNVTNGSNMNMSTRCNPEMVRPSNVLTLGVDTTNHRHPATFPIGLPDFFIKLLTEPGDLVFDPFAGSGTTLVSAQNLCRHYIGTELNPTYIPLILDRLKPADA